MTVSNGGGAAGGGGRTVNLLTFSIQIILHTFAQTS